MLVELELFVMLVLANGSPVVARKLFRQRFDRPVDGGRVWRDGRPVLGKSKTGRGLVAGSVSTGLFSLVVGMGFMFGLVFGLLALLGDLISSFSKRRLGLVSSSRATGLDQVPEALLPMLLAAHWLSLGWWSVAGVVLLFAVSNIWVSPLLFRLRIRKRPH